MLLIIKIFENKACQLLQKEENIDILVAIIIGDLHRKIVYVYINRMNQV